MNSQNFLRFTEVRVTLLYSILEYFKQFRTVIEGKERVTVNNYQGRFHTAQKVDSVSRIISSHFQVRRKCFR